jgi:hypothetical protein
MAVTRRGGDIPRTPQTKSRDALRRLHRPAPTERMVPSRRGAVQVPVVCLYAARRRGVHPFLVAGLRGERSDQEGAVSCWQDEVGAEPSTDQTRRRRRPRRATCGHHPNARQRRDPSESS